MQDCGSNSREGAGNVVFGGGKWGLGHGLSWIEWTKTKVWGLGLNVFINEVSRVVGMQHSKVSQVVTAGMMRQVDGTDVAGDAG